MRLVLRQQYMKEIRTVNNEAVTRNKKVGILTFLHTLNYGAMLQAYALARVLQSAEFDTVQLDYRCPAVEAFEFKHVASLKGRLANLIRMPIIRRKAQRFNAFRRENIPSLGPLSRGELIDACALLDYVVVGSDQVWNGLVTNFDSTYFLDFIDEPQKKRTYAVSIGQDQMPVVPGVDYAHLVGDFPYLLVREKTAINALESLCPGNKYEVVLDPTLLLTRDEWLDKAKEGQIKNEGPYVFVYAVGETKNSVAAAKEIARRNGLDVVVLQQNGFLPIPGATNLFSISPTDFLSYIANAETVVTSSFHGTCLSIQLERNFYVSYATGREKRNSRMGDLLDICGLTERILGGSLAGVQSIDWSDVRDRLEKKRADSLRMLFESLGGGIG